MEKFKVYPHICVENVLKYVNFRLFCYEMDFIAMCAVFSGNMFCRDVRTFAWRKIEAKNDKYEVCEM